MQAIPTPGAHNWHTQLNAVLRELQALLGVSSGELDLTDETIAALVALPGSDTHDAVRNVIPQVSIMDYGAARDGVTNDGPALAAAIAATGWPANAGHVILPPGPRMTSEDYVIEDVVIDAEGLTSTPHLVIDGMGCRINTVTPGKVMIEVRNSVISSTGVSFRDLQLNINAADGIGILLDNAELVHLFHCYFGGAYATGVKITGTSTFITVNDCGFANLSRGIEIAGIADYLTVIGCQFAEQVVGDPLNWIEQTVADVSVGVKIVGNTFYSTGATRPALHFLHTSSLTITGNMFERCWAGAILIGYSGSADVYTITGNCFMRTQNGHDIEVMGGQRGTIQGNQFGYRLAPFTPNTYANIRIHDPFGSDGGKGTSIVGNVSSESAANLSSMIELDASVAQCAIIGNTGAAGVVAAHASNQLVGNIAA